MYIFVDTDGQAALCEQHDFTGLKVVSLLSSTAMASLLVNGSSWAAGMQSGNIWISEEWLRGQAARGEEQWTEQFDRMLAYACGKGWTDPVRHTVRAHIEFRDDANTPVE
jgi:hypothetical protein